MPLTPNDLNNYGAWISPEGEVIGVRSHPDKAKEIILQNKWHLEPQKTLNNWVDNPYPLMLKHGWIRVVFRSHLIEFYGSRISPSFILELVQNFPEKHLLITDTAESYRAQRYENAEEYKDKSGLSGVLDAQQRNELRGEDNPNASTGNINEANPVADLSLAKKYVKNICKFAKK